MQPVDRRQAVLGRERDDEIAVDVHTLTTLSRHSMAKQVKEFVGA
jgi:hypothetical protein